MQSRLTDEAGREHTEQAWRAHEAMRRELLVELYGPLVNGKARVA